MINRGNSTDILGEFLFEYKFEGFNTLRVQIVGLLLCDISVLVIELIGVGCSEG